jgi:surfactin synthase thioesterase subunit
MKRTQKLHVPPTPEFLRGIANREARRIGQYGWRPTQEDLAQLRSSTGDTIAYRVTMRAWRKAGFRVRALRKLAGRSPAHEFRTQSAKAPDAALHPETERHLP